MIQHIWSVLCQRSIIDSKTNNISLFDVFEQLEINITPSDTRKITPKNEVSIPVQYELVNFWSKTKENQEEKGEIKIVFLDPNNKVIKTMKKELTIPTTNRRIRDINKIQGIPLKGSGIYTFIISIKFEGNSKYQQVAKLPLEIKISKDIPRNTPSEKQIA